MREDLADYTGGTRAQDRPVSAAVDYPKVPLFITGLFAFYVVIWWLEIGLRRPFFMAIRIEFAVGAVLGALAAYRYFTRSGTHAKENRTLVTFLLLYLAVLLLGVPFAIDETLAWDTYVNRVLKFALLTFFISQFVTSPQTMGIYLLSCFAAFFKIGLESLVSKINGSQVWESQGVQRLFGIQGTMFGHPNALSGKFVSSIPFIWFLFPVLENRWLRYAFIVQIVFAINILIFTASRTGYLTVIVMATIIVIMSHRKGPLISLFLALAVSAVVFTPSQYKERFVSAFTGQEAEGRSSDTRKGLFWDSMHVFAENPGGVGLLNFPVAQERAGRNVQETHNLYTQALAETGIQGSLAFLVLVGAILGRLRKVIRGFGRLIVSFEATIRGAPSPESDSDIRELQRFRLMLAVCRATLVFVLVRLVLGIFGHDLFEIYWWMAAGIALASTNILTVAQQRLERLQRYGHVSG